MLNELVRDYSNQSLKVHYDIHDINVLVKYRIKSLCFGCTCSTQDAYTSCTSIIYDLPKRNGVMLYFEDTETCPTASMHHNTACITTTGGLKTFLSQLCNRHPYDVIFLFYVLMLELLIRGVLYGDVINIIFMEI